MAGGGPFGDSSGREGRKRLDSAQKRKVGERTYVPAGGEFRIVRSKTALTLCKCRLGEVEDAVEKSGRRRCGDERLG